jgi:hypothetical protein
MLGGEENSSPSSTVYKTCEILGTIANPELVECA